jgi:polyphosphate kinase 2 (PPK2 family)
VLELIDLDRRLSKADYRRQLSPLQRRLLALQQTCWRVGVPTVIVFDGWNAAGKGHCIRKLTERLEPRGFDLQHVTDQPRTYEKDLPWMWRFWLAMPAYGKLAIFDRSWNHRAWLARVEGEASDLQWRRALRDIGDFERMLSDDGYVFVKLFLHISRSDQRKRYEAWKKDPGSSWKALEGSWQKPTPYDAYLPGIEELLQHTETTWSPWKIVPATDSRWARVVTLQTVIERLESALRDRDLELPLPLPPEVEAAYADDDNGDEEDED